MSRKKRMKDIREAKDRRAKRLAIGGAVLLVLVLAFEMPKVLKHSGGSNSATPPAATTTTPTGAPTTGAPSTAPATTAPGTAAAAVLPTAASTQLPNSDTAPKASKSQLFSFSRFAGKDPFVQQVNTSTSGGSSGGSSSGSSSSSSAAAAGVITAGPPSTAASVSYGSGGSQARTLAKTGAVTLSVNGSMQTVRVGASFPSANPLFTLVSVAHGVVRVGIANGSYASGTQTVALTAGRTLTLVDTADGAHYKLRLVSGA
jgi:hypothetical protein